MGQAAARPQTYESNRLGVSPYGSRSHSKSFRSDLSLSSHSIQDEDHLQAPSIEKERELFSATPLNHTHDSRLERPDRAPRLSSSATLNRSKHCNRRRFSPTQEHSRLQPDLRQSIDVTSTTDPRGSFYGEVPIIYDSETIVTSQPNSSELMDSTPSTKWAGLVAASPLHNQLLREVVGAPTSPNVRRRNDKHKRIDSWLDTSSSPLDQTDNHHPWEPVPSDIPWSDDDEPLHNHLPIVGIHRLSKQEYVAARKGASLNRYPSMKRRNSQRTMKLGTRQNLRAKSQSSDSKINNTLSCQTSRGDAYRSSDHYLLPPSLGTGARNPATSVKTSTARKPRARSDNGLATFQDRPLIFKELLEMVNAAGDEIDQNDIDIPLVQNLIRRSTTKRRRSSGPVSIKKSTRKNTPPSRSCEVCGDEKPRSTFLQPTNKCKHTRKTCRDCLDSWITSSMESNGWEGIRCPDCKELFEHPDVQRCSSAEIFERYDSLATRKLLNTTLNFRWCLSPSCKSGQIHDSGADGPLFTCAACRYQVCVVHNCVWHSGETCTQYEDRTNASKKRKEEEEASEQKITETTKKCPGKDCGWKIEKNNGCDHMTCVKCRHEFCWLCFADYQKIRKQGNVAHKESCKYHSSHIR